LKHSPANQSHTHATARTDWRTADFLLHVDYVIELTCKTPASRSPKDNVIDYF